MGGYKIIITVVRELKEIIIRLSIIRVELKLSETINFEE